MNPEQQRQVLKAAVRLLAALDTIALMDAVSLSSNFPSPNDIKKMSAEAEAAQQDLRDAVDAVLFGKAHPRAPLSADSP